MVNSNRDLPEPGSAEYDRLAIAAFGDLLASGVHDASAFYDVLDLPYPKADILIAIENEVLRETSPQRVEWLRTGAVLLTRYQEGVGFKPAYLLGAKLEDLPDDPRERAGLLVHLQPEAERALRFAKLSENEGRLIMARTAAALALKKAREEHRSKMQQSCP